MVPITTFTPVSPEAHAALLAEDNYAADPERPTRSQLLALLSQADLSVQDEDDARHLARHLAEITPQRLGSALGLASVLGLAGTY